MDINKPDVIAQINAVFDDYEAALLRNDLATLDRYFWNAPATVRYGVVENLYGYEAISAHRRQWTPVHPARRIGRRVTTSFGDDTGTVSIEFTAPDNPRVGRQMQTWVRFAEGWRIVAAHVSIP